MKFEELQTVNLRGAIVAVYQDGKAYEIEIVNSDGTTTTVFTIEHKDLVRMNQQRYHGYHDVAKYYQEVEKKNPRPKIKNITKV